MNKNDCAATITIKKPKANDPLLFIEFDRGNFAERMLMLKQAYTIAFKMQIEETEFPCDRMIRLATTQLQELADELYEQIERMYKYKVIKI
uniref:Uncharacterized protein n=1 Tax=Siphoviridae sp. ctrvp54 TaxID=2825690 RepID=A0A8S5P6Z4_9CAUD|nr:MAG TPA: hypothetical protein [Siphoviridae sp. ctrvp54]